MLRVLCLVLAVAAVGCGVRQSAPVGPQARVSFAADEAPPLPTHVTVEILPEAGGQAVASVQHLIGINDYCNLDEPPIAPPDLVNPTRATFDDTYTAGRACIVPIPTELPNGSYRAQAWFHALCGPSSMACESGKVLSANTFTVANDPPIDPCEGKVVIDIGDWTRSVPVKGLARVQFSLLRSTSVVSRVALSARPSGGTFVVTDTIAASDVRKMSGVYFALPLAPGRYELLVVASDGTCTAGSDRPMTVDVTP
jgi:hypothetical protein